MSVRKNEAGFSLIEVMVVTAVMSVVFLVLSSAMVQGTNTYAVNVAVTNLEGGAGFLMERVAEELFCGQLAAPVGAGGLSVTFHVPVDADGDGTPLDASGNVEWGFDGTAGWTRRIRFEAVGSLDEADLDEDVNGNGTRTDRFLVGRLVAETLDASGNVVGKGSVLGPAEVLVSDPVPGLDVDGDGADDPIFQAVSGLLRIKLVMGRRDDRGTFHMLSKTLSMNFRN